MLVQLSPAVRIIPPNEVTGSRWLADEVLRKRRFPLSPAAAATLVAAATPREAQDLAVTLARADSTEREIFFQRRIAELLRSGLLVKPGVVATDPDLRWLMELVEEWRRSGWREAAEYHVLTWDYPCVGYAEASAAGLDGSPTRENQAPEADGNRMKLDYARRPGTAIAGDRAPALSARALWSGDRPACPLNRDSLMSTVSLAFGVTGGNAPARRLRRTSPSGGGRHPTEGYVLVRRVDGLRPGWHHITLRPFSLRLVRPEPPDEGALRASLPGAEDSAATIVITSVFERTMDHYREPRTFRTVHMDAGHVAGTIRLAAAAAGVEAAVGDDGDATAVEALLGLDGMSEGYLGHVALYDRMPGRPSAGPSAPLPEPPPSPDDDAPTAAEAVSGWPAGCRIRPSAGTPGIEVADTVTGRSLVLDPAALARTILAGDVPHDLAAPEDEPVREALLRGLLHWNRRGWCPSDQFYVASRRVRATNRRGGIAAAGTDEDETGADRVALPEPAPPGDHDIAQLLLTRRTVRAYSRRPVAASALSGLLWHGFGHLRGATGPGVWRWTRPPGGCASASTPSTGWNPGPTGTAPPPMSSEARRPGTTANG